MRCTLDGEMVIPRPDGTCDFFAPSQTVAARKRESLLFRVFDILMYEDADVRRLPLVEREAELRALVAQRKCRHITYCEHTDLDEPTVWRHAHKLRAEGIISKLATSPYRSERTSSRSRCPANIERPSR